MALSERDEQMLLEMERQFSVEDPELAETMSQPRAASLRLSPRRVGTGVALVLTGLASLVAGVSVRVTRALSHAPSPRSASQGQDRSQKAGKRSFMKRQEERWERRHQDGRE